MPPPFDPLGDGLLVALDGSAPAVARSNRSNPEIDSLLLFGGGLSDLAGYGLFRLRARRRMKKMG